MARGISLVAKGFFAFFAYRLAPRTPQVTKKQQKKLCCEKIKFLLAKCEQILSIGAGLCFRNNFVFNFFSIFLQFFFYFCPRLQKKKTWIPTAELLSPTNTNYFEIWATGLMGKFYWPPKWTRAKKWPLKGKLKPLFFQLFWFAIRNLKTQNIRKWANFVKFTSERNS